MEVFQRQPIKWILIGTSFILAGCIAISLCVLALNSLNILADFAATPSAQAADLLAVSTSEIATQLPSLTSTPPVTPTPTLHSLPQTTPSPSLPAIPAGADFACLPRSQPLQLAELNSVRDGDTIEVLLDGTPYPLRYIGVDTPEQDEPLAAEARQANQDLLADQSLLLVQDVSQVDPYDRLLRYVISGESFVNLELVRQGWALAAEYPPDTACAAVFQEAQQAAQAEGLGIWSAALSGSRAGDAGSTLTILQVFANGMIDPNEPDEFVELRNDSLTAIELSGWTLADKANHLFTFPAFSLQPGQVCRVYTNEVHPESCGFSFAFNETAIWNNGGDCAYLSDSMGNLIAQFCY